MCHHIPGPIENRTFSTLVVRAKTREQAFITAQIPVNASKVETALYANGKHRSVGDTSQKREKVTVGVYTSVERVKDQADGGIMWEMATASDAKGWLPMSVQKMGVPGAVVKDVGLLVGWVAERRKQEEAELAVGAGDT